MLDISIKALGKVVTNAKKAADFVRKRIVVVEKIDGTKLTLVRNSSPFDPNDYTKNWIIAYKGNVIYPTEFVGLEDRSEEIKSSALGTSQYKFVHDHIQSVHAGTGSIPPNTEFFVEFVQNKPTITRDYAKKHGMYLVGYGPTKYVLSKGQLFASAKFEDDPERLAEFRKVLQLGEFPIVFDGNLSSLRAISQGCIDPALKDIFVSSAEGVDFSDPMQIVSLATTAFLQLESSLGGAAEGVVIQVGGDELSEPQLLKILAADQHSKEARGAKKSRFMGSEQEENSYWKEVNAIVDDLLDELPPGEPQEMLGELSSIVYATDDLPLHPVKSKINVQEDVLLTAKLRLLGTGSHRASKIGVIPMAAKPFQAGHDSLIRRAVDDRNDSVIVFVSTGGREEIKSDDMITLWRDYFLPGIREEYGEKVIVRFTDAPTREAMLIAKDLANRNKGTIVRLYGGVDDTGADDAKEKVEAVIQKNPELKGKIIPVSVPRALTAGVSGTAMRKYLSDGDQKSFMSNLPQWLDVEARRGVWREMTNILGKKIQGENLVRRLVKSMIIT